MQDSFKVIFIGDVIGRPGREIIKKVLKGLVKKHNALFVIANAENSASGFGITEKVARDLFSLGIDVLTLGNHSFDKKESENFIDSEPKIVRPLNLSPYAPGRGYIIVEKDDIKLCVVNLIGKVFMEQYDSPFLAIERYLTDITAKTNNIVVDFHAEATSEKKALAFFLDGKVSAIIGTHTHVQTADETVLKYGTAFITDVGMTGSFDSVIGNRVEDVLERFVRGVPRKLEVATGDVRISFVVITIDKKTGKALDIERYCKKIPEEEDEITS